MGANIIEKHFTLNQNMEGPDHKASLNPFQLKEMVNAIRNIEKALSLGAEDTLFTLTHSGSSATLTVGGADHNELIH